MQIKSEQEMIKYGKRIAAELHGGDVVLLYGDLGAGKTTLTKGIASYFGIDSIVSPTFTLMQVYKLQDTRNKIQKISNIQYPISNFIHIDTYRLEDENQLLEIGAQDYIGDPETVCVIEWGEKARKLVEGKKVKEVRIKYDKEGRRITLKG